MINNYEKVEYFWNEFTEYCEDNGISLDHVDDWGNWWDIWKKAVDVTKENV